MTYNLFVIVEVYASYSKWINIEIKLAQQIGKTIIAIELLGSEKTSTMVTKTTNKIVKWNIDSIIAAMATKTYVKETTMQEHCTLTWSFFCCST